MNSIRVAMETDRKLTLVELAVAVPLLSLAVGLIVCGLVYF